MFKLYVSADAVYGLPAAITIPNKA